MSDEAKKPTNGSCETDAYKVFVKASSRGAIATVCGQSFADTWKEFDFVCVPASAGVPCDRIYFEALSLNDVLSYRQAMTLAWWVAAESARNGLCRVLVQVRRYRAKASWSCEEDGTAYELPTDYPSEKDLFKP